MVLWSDIWWLVCPWDPFQICLMELLDDEDDATNAAVVMIPWHPEKQLQLHLLLWDGWFHSPHFSIVRSFGYQICLRLIKDETNPMTKGSSPLMLFKRELVMISGLFFLIIYHCHMYYLCIGLSCPVGWLVKRPSTMLSILLYICSIGANQHRHHQVPMLSCFYCFFFYFFFLPWKLDYLRDF